MDVTPIKKMFPNANRRYQILKKCYKVFKEPQAYVKFAGGWAEPPTYNQDGLATAHNSDCLNEPLFQEAYQLGMRTGSFGGSQIQYRAYIACWAGKKGMGIDGDFVECGVNRGGLSRAVIHYADFANSGKTFWLLDTYKGFDPQFLTDDEKIRHLNRPARFSECYEEVCKTFALFSNVKVIRGSVPTTLVEVKADKIAYLSIDMNCVGPEIEAAEYFWEKMSSGAVMVLDDYGFANHEDQKKGFDEFAISKGVRVLSLPTGQGLIFKE